MREFGSRLALAGDVSPADWVQERIDTFGPVVGGMLPRGFAAYAQILHPAFNGDRPVRWAEVAAWAGRPLEPAAWFQDICVPAPDRGDGPAPWTEEPRNGEIPAKVLAVLTEILLGHTTARRGWFCLWEGWGFVHGSMSRGTAWPVDNPPPPGTPSHFEALPAFPSEVRDGPKVLLPHREYLLFEGPLEAAGELGGTVSWRPVDDAGNPIGSAFAKPLDTSSETHTPSLFWPSDHAWCAANEIDASFTCVGGSRALIEAMLNQPELEVMPVET